jgi:hypothetical protein
MTAVAGDSLQCYLEKPRQHDAAGMQAEIEAIHRVCWVVLAKVSELLQATREMNFSHRDLQDNNLMVRVREPVTSHRDVDVTLLDFGRSMAMIDGVTVSAGMVFGDPPVRPWVYNATADTVRMVMSMHRSLMASFEAGAHGADGWVFPSDESVDASLHGQPWNLGDAWAFPDDGLVPDSFFEQALPLADIFSGFLSHCDALNPQATVKASEADGSGKPVQPGLVGFTRAAMNRQRQVPRAASHRRLRQPRPHAACSLPRTLRRTRGVVSATGAPAVLHPRHARRLVRAALARESAHGVP